MRQLLDKKSSARQSTVRFGNSPRSRALPGLECLERRDLLAASNLFSAPVGAFPQGDLVQPPIIRSSDGVLTATMDMVSAGFDTNPIRYGDQLVLSSLPDPNSGNNPNRAVYAMGYNVSVDGQPVSSGFPGPIFQLQQGDTINLKVSDKLADPETPPSVVFETNLHTHGLHVSDLSEADNVYRQISPGESMNVSISIPANQPSGVNWYHTHRHGSTHEQVYGGLSGMMVIGDPLDPWPQYKGKVTELYMGLSEANIKNGHLANYTANINGSNFYQGWQKRINGQMNPTIHVRPGETQVWNIGSIGAFGGANLAITDGNLLNPWNGTILVQDGNGQNVQPYALSLKADPQRMQDLAAATLVMPGNRLTLAVTAPTTPGTYYLIDGWGGQDKPAVVAGQQQFYVLATITVGGIPVQDPTPTFGPVGQVDPLFYATPDIKRTYEFSIIPDPGGNTLKNQFLINGKTFGEGVMPQVQIGTVEEWTLTNPISPLANANHPFHIHQGDFIVTAVNGIPVNPRIIPPPASSSLAYISGRDVIDIPSGGSITIRFRALDFPGKYVFHCHILKHEDQGMMSPVLQFGPADGLRLPFGTDSGHSPAAVVINGAGDQLGTLRPFPAAYRGEVVTASGLGTSQAFQTIAIGTGQGFSNVKVYANGSRKPTKSFTAFRGKPGNGVSLAVGDISANGSAVIAVGSRSNGPAVVRLFDLNGKLLREFKNVLPGNFAHGVNVAIGDVNGDNFDDLVISAGKGHEPVVTALDGQDIATGVANPRTIFSFLAGGGTNAGARVAIGYVAPSSVPSYLANIITTPEAGSRVGTVEVWDSGALSGGSDHSSGMTMAMTLARTSGRKRESVTISESMPQPMVSFRPFRGARSAVHLTSNYLGTPGIPIIASWKSPHKVAFSSIDVNNKVTTLIKTEGR